MSEVPLYPCIIAQQRQGHFLSEVPPCHRLIAGGIAAEDLGLEPVDAEQRLGAVRELLAEVEGAPQDVGALACWG